MKHPIGLVKREDSLHAWLLDLPGCIVGGNDIREIEAHVPRAITEYALWLRRHGEFVEEGDAWEFVETQRAVAGDGLFAGDCAPTSRDDLERLIARMEFARADLLAAMHRVPTAVLDWEPPRQAFTSFDAWAPEVRTIRDVARHVYEFELYYREGLRDGPAAGIHERVSDPIAERARTIECLRSLTDEERRRAWHPLRPGRSAPEAWSARKVVRRIISHQRAHAAEILHRRTWAWVSPEEPPGE
jgi:hypothetical protein